MIPSDLTDYRSLPNGGKLQRTSDGRRIFWIDERGEMRGEVLPGTLAAQLLALTPQDYSEAPVQSSPEITAGPQSAPVPHESGIISGFIERWKARARERWEARKSGRG